MTRQLDPLELRYNVIQKLVLKKIKKRILKSSIKLFKYRVSLSKQQRFGESEIICKMSVNKQFIRSIKGIKRRSRSYRQTSLYIKMHLRNRSRKLKVSYQVYAIQGEGLLGFVFKEISSLNTKDIGSPKKVLTWSHRQVIMGLQKIIQLRIGLYSKDLSSENKRAWEVRNLLFKNSLRTFLSLSRNSLRTFVSLSSNPYFRILQTNY